MKHLLRRLAIGGVILAAAAAPQGAGAQTTYTSFASWQAAVGAGNVSWTVDFGGFAADAPFQAVAVDAGPFSLQQSGTSAFRNRIDAPPFEFSEHNGTTHASMYTDFGRITVGMTFDAPVSAWGAALSIGTPAEGIVLDLFSPGDVLLTTLTVGTPTFFGFVLDPGQTVDRLVFRSASDIAGSTGEGFGIDDVVGANAAVAAVPEPGTVALLGLGLAALAAARGRRGARG